MADAIRVLRCREGHRRLVRGRVAAGHEQQPRPEGLEDARRAAVLAVDGRAEHVPVEGAGPVDVGDDEDVGQRHAVGGEGCRHGGEGTLSRCGPTGTRAHDERRGLLAAAGAAILYGAAYPATAVALQSFTPLAIAGIACTIALPFVIAAALAGLVARPRLRAVPRGA